MFPMRDINSALSAGEQSIVAAAAAGEQTTDGVDRKDYQSAECFLIVGEATGSPTSFSVVMNYEESASLAGGSAGEDYSAVTGETVTVTTENGFGRIGVNLSATDRYGRLSATVTFVGGSNPTIPIAFGFYLGGARLHPASSL